MRVTNNKVLSPQHRRAIHLIEHYIQHLQLDLHGYKVLTEVGSGNYLYLPLIAAMAGAAQVFAWTKDSSYGNGNNIVRECTHLIESIQKNIEIDFAINERPVKHLKQADIITNSGFVRPLNQSMLKDVKRTAVIPLMFEAWEIRVADIDIEYCKIENIKVAGTNESHSNVGVFEFVRSLAVKLALNAGMEILNNKIIVWSDDDFGKKSAEAFKAMGARAVCTTTDLDEFHKNVTDTDFIFICDYSETASIIGKDGLLNLETLKMINPSLTLVHLYGEVDFKYATDQGFNIYPLKNGSAKTMTETLGYAGLNPIIALQTAGLKVAQEMLTNKISSLSQPITF